MRIFSAEEMRRLEEELISGGTRVETLMFTAGVNSAGIIRNRFLSPAGQRPFARVTVICGGGNNGGDGIVAAMELEKYCPVTCILVVPEDKLAYPARFFAEKYTGKIVRTLPCGDEFPPGTVIIDALAGIGLKGVLRENLRIWAEAINSSGCPVVSLDIPSGLECDTGKCPDGACFVRADMTVAAGVFKPCHISSDICGLLELASITDSPLRAEDAAGKINAVTRDDALPIFRPRSIAGHKNLAGRIAVAAGSSAYSGAPVLAVSGAMAGGAGIIRLTIPSAALAGRHIPPEIILNTPDGEYLDMKSFDSISAAASQSDVLLAGPGMGTAPGTGELVREIMQNCELPVIADADCLNLLAGHPEWCSARKYPTVLTPHPGEARRLAPETADMSRPEQALFIAKKYNGVVLLKGCRSVIAAPDGRCSINTSGSTVLSTAGSGDVLAGLLAALLPGNDPFCAAASAAWLHGKSGEISPFNRGTAAGDLPGLIVKFCAANSRIY